MTAWLSVTNNADTHATYQLQTTLQTLGYPVAIDGRFGVGTGRAVVAFQRATADLEADGNCGPATWAALEAATAPKPKKKAADGDAEAAPKAAAKAVAKKPATKGTKQ